MKLLFRERLAEYPVNKSAANSPAMFGLHACTYALFYPGWEFHFRGFLQFGLRGRLGLINAILIQVMASSLLHIGKPPAETFAAIGGGVVWGVIAHRTQSLLPGLLQHFLLGIALDYFICYV
ncbi:MAG: CPBP family intramembrane glutamic endopeptidase [Thermoguttaceae bacterium]